MEERSRGLYLTIYGGVAYVGTRARVAFDLESAEEIPLGEVTFQKVSVKVTITEYNVVTRKIRRKDKKRDEEARADDEYFRSGTRYPGQ